MAASLLGADPLNLERDLRAALDEGIDHFHIDAMDGHFVPNIAFGPDTAAALRPLTNAVFDVHLMLTEPQYYIDTYIDAGADWVTIHMEAGQHHHRHLTKIRQAGRKAGLAINPATPVEAIAELVEAIDVLLIMSVNPGYGGASFIPNAVSKVRRAAEMRRARGAEFLISVDGGVDESNIAELAESGAEVFVTGSALFRRGNVGERASILMSAIAAGGEPRERR